MGLLDRFKKEPGPDALTWEAVARIRVVPGVAGAEAVDADTVGISWAGQDETSTVSLAAVRADWAKASGFARIELMDDLVAGLAPPVPGSSPPADPASAAPAPPTAAETADAPADHGTPAAEADPWSTARGRLRVVVGRPGAHPAAVAWPVAGVLEARAVLGGPGALAVDAGDLAAWNVGPGDVRAAAEANLAATDPGLDPIGPGQPAWVPTAPADHPPAWLAVPEQLLRACGLSEAVVLAPTPTELVVVDPGAHGVLASILASTKSIVAEQARILWPAPLLVTADGVGPWKPAPEHPCADQVAELDPEA